MFDDLVEGVLSEFAERAPSPLAALPYAQTLIRGFIKNPRWEHDCREYRRIHEEFMRSKRLRVCAACGVPITQPPGKGRPRLTCSTRCMTRYWRKRRKCAR
jgi:hypothetical protein